MADKAISELPAASQVTPTDLFVLEQSNTAKKLTGQILENWLVSFADGHGGIQSILKTATNGLVDTYTITLSDATTYTITVANGKGVTKIEKTSTSGLVDTHTITYNDGTTSTFTVTNGAKGDKGDNSYVWIRYASQEPTASSHDFGVLPDDWMGIYSGNSATAPTDYTQYQWSKIKGEKGDTGDPAVLTSQSVQYQVSDSGTITPSGAWSTSVPVVPQGKYLWTRTTTTYNTGSPVVSYSIARMGIDGTGSVSSVCGVSPDPDGDVTLTAANVDAMPTTGGDFTGPVNMNGQKLSGLNSPTADDDAATKGYLDTETENMKTYVDTEVSGVKTYAAGLRVRNLLDNSDWSNPVAQAGLSGAHGNKTYIVDRWPAEGYLTGVAQKSNGISFSTSGFLYVYQKVKGVGGKTLTFAYKTSKTTQTQLAVYDDTLSNQIIVESVMPVDGIALITFYVPAENDTSAFVIYPENGEIIEWLALYEGEYNVETLPPYVPKGYATELAECRRYYQSFTHNSTFFFGNSGAASGAGVCLVVPSSVKMRINPTVSAFSISVMSGETVDANSSAIFTPTICISEAGFLSLYGNIDPANNYANYQYRAIIAQLRNAPLGISADL